MRGVSPEFGHIQAGCLVEGHEFVTAETLDGSLIEPASIRWFLFDLGLFVVRSCAEPLEEQCRDLASEAEYLARLTPPSVAATSHFSRRGFLRVAAGAGALLGAPTLLTACGGDDDDSSAGGGGTASGTVSFGLNEAEGAGVPFDQRQAMIADFQEPAA